MSVIDREIVTLMAWNSLTPREVTKLLGLSPNARARTCTTFYDNNGDAVQLVSHLSHQSNDVNSVTGPTLHEHGHFTITLDLITGVATVTGNSEVANLPGSGVVVQDVGRTVFDADGNLVFFAGGRNHSGLFGGDQVWCDALS